MQCIYIMHLLNLQFEIFHICTSNFSAYAWICFGEFDSFTKSFDPSSNREFKSKILQMKFSLEIHMHCIYWRQRNVILCILIHRHHVHINLYKNKMNSSISKLCNSHSNSVQRLPFMTSFDANPRHKAEFK